ncbi:Ubiquitin-like modifier-activating enzyme ATG7 [Pseudolycoriella hygida]|uniref:Ubiquitin-like modifier-activating enzyme ATG7 n=1 Tax=Pseudolycoriella hygida TaxID=35572 RepID=A0A9Q0MN31_9DIPT|nr:Ubiquitin-like modifier-activating enzyme ATG7 [Pseudolycoriella hygida]
MRMADNILKFVPIESFVSPTFWYKLAEIKLDVDRLNDAEKRIHGQYTNLNSSIQCINSVDSSSFNENPSESFGYFVSHGVLYNKNTIEDFKDCDKVSLMNDEGRKIWESIIDGSCIDNPSLFVRFFVLSFADIKKYKFHYFFAYPTLSHTVGTITDPAADTNLKTYFSTDQLKQFNELYQNIVGQSKKSFFILESNENGLMVKHLSEYINHKAKESNFQDVDVNALYFCYSDLTSHECAGWPLRLFLVPNLRGKDINIISVRFKKLVGIEASLLFKVSLSNEDVDPDNLTWIGYERNAKGKILSQTADMASIMDPEKLAKTSVQLNLKLMKWRLLPELNLDKISSTKCLLMGAGTLGCSVSRNLLAWGVDVITFVDYGKVSRSNPVRQSLFTYADTLNGGKEKAKTAAERLKHISPGIQPSGYNLHIPMPGHTIGDAMLKETLETIKTLEDLVQSHDVIFLLTDSRESRWLPTLLGAAHNKIVINAALGFDSYLVMRHGTKSNNDDSSAIKTVDGLKCIPGDKLGCYFCNDITAPVYYFRVDLPISITTMGKRPAKKRKLELVFDEKKRKEYLTGFRKRKQERRKKARDDLELQVKEERKRLKQEAREDIKSKFKLSFAPIPELADELNEEEFETEDVKSLKDRTLDMQCTVTRPGVSNIAGSLAVELLISLLQHKGGKLAPAYFGAAGSSGGETIPEGLLGIIPHSIRGIMSTYTQILPATEKFSQCVACSEKVLNEYAVRGNEFLLDVFASNKYLEDLTGISELINEQHVIIDMDDSDFELSD